MFQTILPALISGGVTLTVCLINNAVMRAEQDRRQKETIALIEYKLDELQKRVDKHNNVVERTYHIENEISVIKAKMEV